MLLLNGSIGNKWKMVVVVRKYLIGSDGERYIEKMKYGREIS